MMAACWPVLRSRPNGGPAAKHQPVREANGGVLNSLGLTDRKLTNQRTVLILSRAIREQAHELQRMHTVGTQTAQQQIDNCPLSKVKGGDSTTSSKDQPPKPPGSRE